MVKNETEQTFDFGYGIDGRCLEDRDEGLSIGDSVLVETLEGETLELTYEGTEDDDMIIDRKPEGYVPASFIDVDDPKIVAVRRLAYRHASAGEPRAADGIHDPEIVRAYNEAYDACLSGRKL